MLSAGEEVNRLSPMCKAARYVFVLILETLMEWLLWKRNWGRKEERYKELSEILSPTS